MAKDKKKKQKPLVYNGHAMSCNELYYVNGGKEIEVASKGHDLTYTIGEPSVNHVTIALTVPKNSPIHVKTEGEASTDTLASYVELNIGDEAVNDLFYALAGRVLKRKM